MPLHTEPSANNALGGLPGFDEETCEGVRRLAVYKDNGLAYNLNVPRE